MRTGQKCPDAGKNRHINDVRLPCLQGTAGNIKALRKSVDLQRYCG